MILKGEKKGYTFVINDYFAQQRLQELDDGYYNLDIRKIKNTRSLEQNKLLWKNIKLIADELGEDVMDTYCNILESADAKSEFIIAKKGIEDDLRRNFRGVRFIREQDIDGAEMNVYKVYIGSSKMKVDEMKVLLDKTFEYLEQLGLDYEKHFE